MPPWLISIILSSIITIIVMAVDSDQTKKNDKTNNAAKIMLISFGVILGGWYFWGPNSCPEIKLGEPPF